MSFSLYKAPLQIKRCPLPSPSNIIILTWNGMGVVVCHPHSTWLLLHSIPATTTCTCMYKHHHLKASLHSDPMAYRDGASEEVAPYPCGRDQTCLHHLEQHMYTIELLILH